MAPLLPVRDFTVPGHTDQYACGYLSALIRGMPIFACCYRSFALEYEVKTRNIRGTSIAAVAALLAVAGCSGTSGGASGGLEKTDIVVDALGAIDSAGLFIAQQDGLFKAQGLNVTIKLTTKSQDAIDGQLA